MKNIEHYMAICNEVAKMSKCLSRKIGTVIVTEDGTLVGMGYNGPVRTASHCDSDERLEWLVNNLKKTHAGDIKSFLLENGWGSICPRQILKYGSGKGLEFCQAAHSERNAIVNSAREGIKIKGCYMIMNCGLPCQECAKEVVNSGIVKIYCKKGPEYDIGSRWILEQGGVDIIQI